MLESNKKTPPETNKQKKLKKKCKYHFFYITSPDSMFCLWLVNQPPPNVPPPEIRPSDQGLLTIGFP